MQSNSYQVALFQQNVGTRYKDFSLLSEAIRWLAYEIEAGDTATGFGEVRFGEAVLWRRGNRDVVSELHEA